MKGNVTRAVRRRSRHVVYNPESFLVAPDLSHPPTTTFPLSALFARRPSPSRQLQVVCKLAALSLAVSPAFHISLSVASSVQSPCHISFCCAVPHIRVSIPSAYIYTRKSRVIYTPSNSSRVESSPSVFRSRLCHPLSSRLARAHINFHFDCGMAPKPKSALSKDSKGKQETLQLYPQSPAVLSPSLPSLSSASHIRSATSQGSEMHIDDVDASSPRRDVLIPPSSPWSTSTSDRQQHQAGALSTSAPHPPFSPSSAFAIQPIQNNFNQYTGQDVLPQLSAHAPSARPLQSQLNHQHVSPVSTFGSPRLPNFPASSHGSVTNAPQRLRTTHPVFGNTSKLAQHYGIPTKLPPTPRIIGTNTIDHTSYNSTARASRPPVPPFNAPPTSSEPSSSTSYTTPFELNAMVQSYINMLSNQPQEAVNGPSAPEASLFGKLGVPSPFFSESESEELIWWFAGGSHDYTSSNWSEFLTSPILDEDSPFEGALDTPAQTDALLDFLSSPAIADNGPSGQGYPDMPLFGTPFVQDVNKLSLENGATEQPTINSSNALSTPFTPSVHDFDSLLTMSPATPALDPPSMQTSPVIVDKSASGESHAAAVRRLKKQPNGTRRNLKPVDLVPVDAPTQDRNYLGPSATSRKEVPAIFARKRARSALDEEEDDELAATEGATPGAPTLSEADAIAAKRRQNTLAARRSRKRKLEYQQELEDRLEAVTRERDLWKDRAMSLKGQFRQLNLPEPFWED